jgi:hypothetical protein
MEIFETLKSKLKEQLLEFGMHEVSNRMNISVQDLGKIVYYKEVKPTLSFENVLRIADYFNFKISITE